MPQRISVLQLSVGHLLVFFKYVASHSRSNLLSLPCTCIPTTSAPRENHLNPPSKPTRKPTTTNVLAMAADPNSSRAGTTHTPTTTRPGQRAPAFQFECDLCGDESFEVPSIISPDHFYVVDGSCAVQWVVPMILEAKANEYSHPPSWGNVIIDYKNFLHWLPEGFKDEYRAKRREYRTPLARRIYCRRMRRREKTGPVEQCGAFLGAKANLDGVAVKACPACSGKAFGSCMRCGDVLSLESMSAVALHECTKAESDDATFEGLVRGVHYQICPGDDCHIRVELAEACNALECLGHACRTQFCAICGRRARHDSDHWQAGKPCPRWNLPKSANAGYDPVPEPVEPERQPEPSPQWLAAQHFWTNELYNWRQRPENHMLVRDETYVNYLMLDFERAADGATTRWGVYDLRDFKVALYGLTQLHFRHKDGPVPSAEMLEMQARVSELHERLAEDGNLTLLRLLLLAQHNAFDVLSLTRRITRLLTRDHLLRLMLRCTGVFGVMTVIERTIDEEAMREHPRLVSLVRDTTAELMAFVVKTAHMLIDQEGEIEYDEPDFIDPRDVPEMVDKHVIATYWHKYQELEETRLRLIQKNIPRHPGLAAAIDLFWLQWKNLDTPRLLWEARSFHDRQLVMQKFVARHREIEKYAKQMWNPQLPGELAIQLGDLRRSMTAEYDELAERFKRLIPSDFVSFELMEEWDGD
jgi:hypothetical protein